MLLSKIFTIFPSKIAKIIEERIANISWQAQFYLGSAFNIKLHGLHSLHLQLQVQLQLPHAPAAANSSPCTSGPIDPLSSGVIHISSLLHCFRRLLSARYFVLCAGGFAHVPYPLLQSQISSKNESIDLFLGRTVDSRRYVFCLLCSTCLHKAVLIWPKFILLSKNLLTSYSLVRVMINRLRNFMTHMVK